MAGSENNDLLLWFGRDGDDQAAKTIAKVTPPPVLFVADPMDGGLGSRLAVRFNLHFLPAAILLRAGGEEIDRLEGVDQTAKLSSRIAAWRAGKGILATILKREKEMPGDIATRLGVARELLSRGMLEEADKRLAGVIAAEADEAFIAEALLERGLLLLRTEKRPEAEQNLRMLCEDHADTKASTEGELTLARLLALEGDKAAAVKILERFGLRHPGDPLVREAAKLLQDLSPK